MKHELTTHPFDHVSDASKEEIQRILRRDRIYNETREDLYCNSRYSKFFSHFSEESVREFIDAYAGRKADYLVNGEQRLRDDEGGQLYFRQWAERCFWEIQQKKLFDAQCRWRAGELKLDGIDVTRDFFVAEFDISRTALVPPVTREELNIYLDFLASGDYDPAGHGNRWQHYDYFKSCHESGASLPAWYAFYDDAIGTGALLSLPDIKGEKESRYLEAGLAGMLAKTPEPVLPELTDDYKTLDFFIATFEDRTLARYFRTTEKNHPDISEAAEVDEALRILRLADEDVPVAAAGDWKNAVCDAARKFRVKKIGEALRNVFNEYQLRQTTGLSFGGDADTAVIDLLKRKVARYKEAVLAGRGKLGEPADFNY